MKKILMICLCLMMAVPAFAAEFLKTGDRAIVANCKEYITLRESPDSSAPEIRTIQLGETVNITGMANSDFAAVTYRDDSGYVLSKYLEICDTYTGDPVTLSEEERYNINLFLSNFSEQGLKAYDAQDMEKEWKCEQEDFYLNFAIYHININRRYLLEMGDFSLATVRLHKKYLPDVIWDYFKYEVSDLGAALTSQAGDYYYWDYTDAPVSEGFVCLNGVDNLGEDRYAVRFDIYGAGTDWTNDVCHFTAEEAAGEYIRKTSGMAVIATDGDGGSGTLLDRSTWRLERWMVE